MKKSIFNILSLEGLNRMEIHYDWRRDNFVLYSAMEWDPDYIQWYINGEPFYRFDNPHISNAEWPFDIPFYLILNLAIGGTWGGQQGIDEKMEKAEMIVDYVRVYQKN